jgi:hypothetical protein
VTTCEVESFQYGLDYTDSIDRLKFDMEVNSEATPFDAGPAEKTYKCAKLGFDWIQGDETRLRMLSGARICMDST